MKENSDKLKISIVTPTYNRRNLIDKSIKSSLNFISKCKIGSELIIVDDGSTDNTSSYLSKKYSTHINNNIIKLFTLPLNNGVTYAKQFGAKQSTGYWIIFMDSDDHFINEKTSDIITCLENNCKYPIIFFRCLDTVSLELIGENQNTPIVRNARELLLYGTLGECLPVVNRSAIIKYPFITSLKGFESLTYIQISNMIGDVLISPIIARYYNRDENIDRLSSRKNIKERSCELAQGNLMILKMFSSKLRFSVYRYVIKYMYYKIICINNSIK